MSNEDKPNIFWQSLICWSLLIIRGDQGVCISTDIYKHCRDPIGAKRTTDIANTGFRKAHLGTALGAECPEDFETTLHVCGN